MSISPCPEPWELKLFALGTMSAEAAQRINDHLNECNACVTVLASEAETRRGAFPFPFLEPPVEPDEIGRLGEYRILRLLQSGGMGMVFHAEDIALRRSVALKILKPELEAANTASKRFLREAQLLAAIKHEHVVTIFDAGQVGPVVYLAMELLEGQSLADLLKSARPLSVPEILCLGREIASGLAAIHRQGLIHRDIKPANIDAELKRFPVDSVSWDDCQIFIATLNEQVKESGWVYRLPKEAEWEYACRGGPLPNKEDYGFDFYAGDPTNTLAPDSANFEGTGLKRTAKVGFSRPNRLGLFDMHGNVFELCDDHLFDDKGGPLRALRGGAWCDPARFCRAGRRGVGAPSHRNTGGGLRLARVPAVKESRARE